MSAALTPAAGPAGALRATLVWRGEVMGDQVSVGKPVTLGASGASTFVIPDLALPAEFAIIRPGNRGYLLTLSAGMQGSVCLDGQRKDVAEFVRRGGEGGDGVAGDFRATPIGARDWGVIELDGSGDYVLFFQFVAVEPPLPTSRFRAELLLPALAFSLLLHTIMLWVTYQFDDDTDDVVYPGPDDLTGRYLISRLEALPDPPPPPPVAPAAAAAAASQDGEVKKVNSATAGESGRAGGKGETERARDPDAKIVPPDLPPPPPKVAFMTGENRQMLDTLIKSDVRTQLGKYTGLPGPKKDGGLGFGKGTGTGVGDDPNGVGTTRGGKGNGTGGGGSVQGDFVSQGKIDTGETRRPKGTGGTGSGVKEVAIVGTGAASGDFGGLTKEEIDKVVKSRSGLIKSCYQRELDKTKGLGGKLVVNFSIAASGDVTRQKVDAGKSTLHNASVEDCVLRQIAKLRFPAKGGGVVNYPFIFSQG
ncbi:MAG: AgmX/PglI C-terminal domain-containing protein [Kofleriaceae bacterium]